MLTGLLALLQVLLLLPLLALFCSKQKKPPANNPNEVLPPAGSGAGTPGKAPEKDKPANDAVDVEP